MKNTIILALFILVAACSSAPTMDDGDSTVSVDESYGTDDVMVDADSDNSVGIIEDDSDSMIGDTEYMVEDEYMQEDEVIQADEMETSEPESITSINDTSSLTPEEENKKLRMEIEELKAIIMGLTNDNQMAANKKSLKNKKPSYKKGPNPVNLVMKFNTKQEQKKWWNILEKAGIKDKFLSNSKGKYLIFLGHFNDHDIALEIKNKIIKATNAQNIETISSFDG